VVFPTAPTIEWQITSDPPGAEVIRKDTAEVLGKTPLLQKRRAQPGPFVVLLRRAGYQSTALSLAADSSHQVDIQLVPVQPPGKLLPISRHAAGMHRRGALAAAKAAPAAQHAPALDKEDKRNEPPQGKYLLEN
jgi:hypothetical protein